MLSTLIGGFAGPISLKQRRLLERAARSCGQGIEMVGDLVKIRRLDEINQEHLGPVDLLRLFQKVLDRGREIAKERGLSLKSQILLSDPEQGRIRGDAGILEELLNELLSNALKYTPKGGSVQAQLLLRSGQPRPEEGKQQHPHLWVEISDTGIGIPQDAYSQIFTEFYRAPNAKRVNKEGSGLGLAFAMRVAQILGGQLHLKPSEMGGVHAILALPLYEGEGGIQLPALLTPSYSQRVVIIGGVVAGGKAAAKIARLDPECHITVIEKGRFLSYSGCGLPYYISGAVREQQALISTPLGGARNLSLFHEQSNTRTLELTEAISIDRQNRQVHIRRLLDREEAQIPYEVLVLACGALPVLPELPGSKLSGIYTLQGVQDAEAIRSELGQNNVKDVVIVGGGLLGTQITESVTLRGARLTLVEARDEILGIVDAQLGALARGHLESNGVRVIIGQAVCAFRGEHQVQTVLLEDGRELPCDFVILAMGVKPNGHLAEEAGLGCAENGAVLVDRWMRTSDPEIYAIGDCAINRHLLREGHVYYPMGSVALKQGRTAAINICGGNEEFPGILGSIAIRLFDYSIACTGLNEEQARRAGYDPVSVLLPGPDREPYLPTSQQMILKLVADRSSRRLLGAQGVGPGAVCRRIDVVATALSAGMDLDSFCQLDLPYAPPISLGIDLILTAGNLLRNKIEGIISSISADEVYERMKRGELLLLDVRSLREYEDRKISGSLHIPLNSLRGRLHELPRNAVIVLICSIGLRSYEASLILSRAGFESHLLDGGLVSWPFELEQL